MASGIIRSHHSHHLKGLFCSTYLGPILPPMATLALWSLLVIFPVMLMLWKKRWKGAGLLTAAYGILFWVGISTNQPDALRPLLCNVAVACEEQLALTLKFKKIESIEELHQNLADAHAHKQWVMLDFYADWCASCQEMALYTFTDPKVREALSQVVLVQADVTQNSTTDQALLRQFNLIGPPAILFFGPDQQERNTYRVVGYLKADNFLNIIKAISGEEYTQLAGLFVHFLRCKKGYIARYAPLFTP